MNYQLAGTTMKTISTGQALALSLLALTSAAALGQLPFGQQEPGQELTLFQDDGNGGGRGGMVQIMAPPDSQEASGSALVLKGIYRFGDTYHVSLANSDGGVYKATWKAGDSTPVSVANGYQIQLVDNRTVTLGLPAGVNCQSNTQSGSNCLGRNQVSLSFAETAPTSSRRGFSGRSSNNNDDIPSFIRDRIANSDDPRAREFATLIEAAQSGDPAARARAEQMIREQRGNRGGGNNNGGGGGRGGRGGGGGNNNTVDFVITGRGGN